MQSFFMKKVPPYFVEGGGGREVVGGGETLCFIFKTFPISKSSSLTFVVQIMAFQAKLHNHRF